MFLNVTDRVEERPTAAATRYPAGGRILRGPPTGPIRDNKPICFVFIKLGEEYQVGKGGREGRGSGRDKIQLYAHRDLSFVFIHCCTEHMGKNENMENNFCVKWLDESTKSYDMFMMFIGNGHIG